LLSASLLFVVPVVMFFLFSSYASDLEWKILRAKETPGPGGDWALPSTLAGGFHFSHAASKSDLDWAVLRAARALRKSGSGFNLSFKEPFMPKTAPALAFDGGGSETSPSRSLSVNSFDSSVGLLRMFSRKRRLCFQA